MKNVPLPFEVSLDELKANIDVFVEQAFTALESDFLEMPIGEGFVTYDAFCHGYQAIHDATDGFRILDPDVVFDTVCQEPMGLVVVRTILGLSPPEWSDVATMATGEQVGQGFARNMDRSIRRTPDRPIGHTSLQEKRIRALVASACKLLAESNRSTAAGKMHRLDKVDTAHGIDSLTRVASEGVDYASLLYERFLGRPFASHRDSVSEIVGGELEDRIERHLEKERIAYVRTTRSESIYGWEQNPDFFAQTRWRRSP